MLKYNVRAYPMTFTNDLPVIEKEIIAKKVSPYKIIKDFYGRKVTYARKTSDGYMATSGYANFKIEVAKVGFLKER